MDIIDIMDARLPDVMPGTPHCKLTVLNAGFCITKKGHLLEGSGWEEIKVPALWFLIEHPGQGKLLFDTGYSTRFFDYTTAFPFSLMRKLTPVEMTEQDNALAQLQAMGIQPQEISAVLLSHLHVDHAGGIADFQGTPVYVDKLEWEHGQRSALHLLRQGYIKRLYAGLDPSGLRLLDFEQDGRAYGPFAQTIDLFQDGSIILIPLCGHAVGQFGLLLNVSSAERYFLVADAAYMPDNYRKNRTGSFLSRLSHADPGQYKAQFTLLRRVEEANPNLTLIASHDLDAYTRFVGTD